MTRLRKKETKSTIRFSAKLFLLPKTTENISIVDLSNSVHKGPEAKS